MDDNTASVREEARKRGGDELVAKVDAALAQEMALADEMKARMDAIMAQPEGEERTMAMVAMNEALSTSYGRSCVAYGKANNVDDAQIMVLAIRSLVNSVQTAIDDRDAGTAGILDLIVKASDAEKTRKEGEGK